MNEPRFTRIVVGLYHDVPDDSIRVAAEVAGLMGLKLIGFFVEEQDLIDLAAMPFVREFRPFGGGWARIDAEQIARDLAHASRAAQRLLAAAARESGAASRFHSARGALAETIASILRTGDIVIVAEPPHPAAQASPRFETLMRAAFASAATVLLVPRRIVRRSGDVVAVATSPDDPTPAVGAVIAAAAREGLVVVDAVGPTVEVQAPAGMAGAPKAVRIRPAGTSPEAIMAALATVRERLLVINRQSFADNVALALARTRGVPVLVLEPAHRSGG